MAVAEELLNQLQTENLSLLVITPSGRDYRFTKPGVQPLLELLELDPSALHGATIADRVVGSCAARIFVHIGAANVVGIEGSLAAATALQEAAITWYFRLTVPEIRNRSGDGMCPFEKLSLQHPEMDSFLAAIRDRFNFSSPSERVP